MDGARRVQNREPELSRIFGSNLLGLLLTIPVPAFKAVRGILVGLATLILLLSLFPNRMSASDPSLHPLVLLRYV